MVENLAHQKHKPQLAHKLVGAFSLHHRNNMFILRLLLYYTTKANTMIRIKRSNPSYETHMSINQDFHVEDVDARLKQLASDGYTIWQSLGNRNIYIAKEDDAAIHSFKRIMQDAEVTNAVDDTEAEDTAIVDSVVIDRIDVEALDATSGAKEAMRDLDNVAIQLIIEEAEGKRITKAHVLKIANNDNW